MSNLTGFVKRLRDIMRNDAGINGDAQRIEQIAWLLFLKVYDAKEQDWQWDDEEYQSIIPEECRWQSWAHDDKSGAAMTGDKLLEFVNDTLFPTLKSLPVDAGTPIKKAIVQTTFADANQYMKDGVLLRQVVNVIDELDLSDYEESHAFGEIYESILKELQSAGSAGEFYTPRAVTDFMAQMIRPRIGERMADFACGTGGFITSWLKELKKQVKTTEDEEKYSRSIYGVEKKQFPYMLCITNMLLHDLDVPQVYHDNSLLRDVLDYTEDDQVDAILMNPPYGGSEKAEVKDHFPADLASSETADLFLSVIMYRLAEDGRAAVILPDGFLFGTDNAKVNIKKKLLSEFDLHTVIRMPGSVFSPYTSITTNILFFDRTGPTKETWFYRLDMPEGYKHFSKTRPMKLEHFAPAVKWWDDRQELSEDGFDKAKKFTVQQLTEDLGCNLDQCGYPHEEEEILAPLDLMRQYEERRASLNAEIDRVLEEIAGILNGTAKRSQRVGHEHAWSRLEKFNRQLPVDLRKSILQMAIQGKLVEQRKEEGTAETLLDAINLERQKQMEAKEIKVNKKIESISQENAPFDIPETWEWIRFGHLVNYTMGKTPPRADEKWWGDDCPWVSISDMPESGHIVQTKEFVTRSAISDKFGGKISKAGTLLMSFKLTIGRVSILDVDAVHNEAIISIYPFVAEGNIIQQYLFFILPYITQYGASKNAIKGKTLNDTSISNLPIPLPPLHEQKRIVARLEELLPLCERLK